MNNMKINYQKICKDLLSDLPQRTQEVLEQRFGLKNGERKTLQAIGDGYGICRERVRQIEVDGLERLKPKLEKYQSVFEHFENYLREYGELRKEDILLSSLATFEFQNHLYFLLTLGEKFNRFSENKDFYSFWTINPNSLSLVKEVIKIVSSNLLRVHKPLKIEEIYKLVKDKVGDSITQKALLSFLEVSKEIEQGLEGKFGLRNWPEINPRGIKDRAYLVFKKEKRPLHFREVTELINSSKDKKISQPRALVQTVHNELIKDSRFVLVGRGLYALREWGYSPGTVQEIIAQILKENQRPLSKEEIIEKVLQQRIVKPNTILINLNKFARTSDGKYTLKGTRLG
jgi:predicted Zn-ribbon and HTH transcriptional regulator